MKILILVSLAVLIVAVVIARQALLFGTLLPTLRRHGYTRPIPIVWLAWDPFAAYRELCREHGYSLRGLNAYLWLFVVECLLIAGWIGVGVLMPGRVF